MPDCSLVPWTSPGGKPMQIAAAAPNIPWTDLAYSLAPNGSTLDYVADAPTRAGSASQKQSLRQRPLPAGLARSGLLRRRPGSRPDGRPDRLADPARGRRALRRRRRRRSSTSSPSTTPRTTSTTRSPPAPMLMSSGFTDDLFPADETIRYYNRTRTQYPDADLALFFGDFGHPRAQNKSDVTSALERRRERLVDYYVKGAGTEPAQGVEAYTETCPGTAPVGRPVHGARTGRRWRPGEIRFERRRRADDRPAAGSTDGRGDVQPGPAAAPARPPTAPTSRAPPTTGSTRLPAAATRCSARRR